MTYTFPVVEHGWLASGVDDHTIERAKERMAKRDAEARAAGVSSHFESDLRWVGDLGEMGLSHWLIEELGLEKFKHHGGVDQLPDFDVLGKRVGLKTRYSNVATRADFYAVVPAQHLGRKQEDHWFFANYETTARRLVLLGGIDAPGFRAAARYVDTGELIGPSVRARNPVWQLPITKLQRPVLWICGLSGHPLVGSRCPCGLFTL